MMQDFSETILRSIFYNFIKIFESYDTGFSGDNTSEHVLKIYSASDLVFQHLSCNIILETNLRVLRFSGDNTSEHSYNTSYNL